MESGIVDLNTLYIIAKKDKEGLALDGGSFDGKKYGAEVKALCETIPTVQGFYLFGKYIKMVLWQSIYIGKAGTGKTTNLQARIREELSDERAFMWKGKHTGLKEDDDILAIIAKHYPQANDPRKSRYEPETIRAVRKAGATHIIWVSRPDLKDDKEKEIEVIEADLIETLNPRENKQRNPKDGNKLLGDIIEIIKAMKIQINNNRPAQKK